MFGVINSISSTCYGFLTGLNGLLIDFLAVVSKVIAFPFVGFGEKNRLDEACEEPLSSDVSMIVISLALGKGKPPAFLKSVTGAILKGFWSVFGEHGVVKDYVFFFALKLILVYSDSVARKALKLSSNSCSLEVSAMPYRQKIYLISS